MSGQTIERTLELSDAAAGHTCELLQHAVRKRHLALRTLVSQNRDASFILRHANVDNKTPSEAGNEAFVDIRDLGRRTIARHDDLATTALRCVEDAQHLVLRLAAASQNLHVIDEQQVDALV